VVDVSAPIEPKAPELGRGDRLLLAATLAGPLAWLLQLGIGYALIGPVCARQSRWPLHAVTWAALAAIAVGVMACWRRWTVPNGTAPGRSPRRALAAAGVASGLFFAILVLAFAIPLFVLEPCI
jgi:hypothetical protein